MSGDRKDDKRALVPRPGCEVGYGKPPEKTQFKPGQSGNPKGRPTGAKNKRPGLHEERMKEIILDEAYREIPVREGEKTVTIPMVQAVMRSVSVNAAKGQYRAQRLFAELLSSVESSRRALNDEWLKTAMEYKVGWEKELRRREALGITDLPDPLPHPDHVEIDLDNGTARLIGPRTKEEKVAIDGLIEDRHLLIDELQEIESEKNATEDPRERRRLQRLWQDKLEFIAFINRLAPKTADQ